MRTRQHKIRSLAGLVVGGCLILVWSLVTQGGPHIVDPANAHAVAASSRMDNSFVYLPQVMGNYCSGYCYYVDSVNGSDANPGTSAGKPWRSLAPVHAKHFLPGSNVYLKRGSSWSGGLVINDSGTENAPIVFTAYGTGNRPVISNPGGPGNRTRAVTIDADWVIVEGLRVENAQDAGVRIAYDSWIPQSSDHNVVRDIEATNVGMGIAIEGQHNLVTQNYIHDLHMVVNTPGGGDDYGAVGIWFFNSNNEASLNRLVNCVASSYDYGTDGGAFEWYSEDVPVDNNYVHHNWATGNNGFLEVGAEADGSVKNTVVAYNVALNNHARFASLHLSGSFASDIQNFRLENNTIVEDWSTTQGVLIGTGGQPNADTLSLRNNILYVNFWHVFDPAVEWNFVHSHNLYYLPNEDAHQYLRLDPTEKLANPLFVNLAGRDFHLNSGSPAINAGIPLGYSRDYDNLSVPVGSAPDMGAFERR